MTVKWTLYDPITPETYVFTTNPNQGGTPTRTKKINSEGTAAPDGRTLLFEGREEPRKLEITGTILDQAQLEVFEAWYDKRHQIQLTDDLGRQWWVYINNFQATRNRRAHHPWHHSYTLSFTILDQPT